MAIRGSLTTFSFDDKGRCPTRVAWGYVRPPSPSNLQLRKLAIAAGALKMGNARPETRPYGLLPPKKSARMKRGGGYLTFVRDLFFPFRSSESQRLLPHGVDICDLQSVDYQVGPELLGDHPTFRSLPASFRYGWRRVAREVQRRGCWAYWASSCVVLVTHRPFRKVEGDRAVCKFAWALPSQPICRH
jgi:hypothetical protein